MDERRAGGDSVRAFVQRLFQAAEGSRTDDRIRVEKEDLGPRRGRQGLIVGRAEAAVNRVGDRPHGGIGGGQILRAPVRGGVVDHDDFGALTQLSPKRIQTGAQMGPVVEIDEDRRDGHASPASAASVQDGFNPADLGR